MRLCPLRGQEEEVQEGASEGGQEEAEEAQQFVTRVARYRVAPARLPRAVTKHRRAVGRIATAVAPSYISAP